MKRILLFLFALVSVPVFAQQMALPLPPAPAVAAKAYLLSDFYSEQLLVAQNIHERMEPASLTKLMTAYVVFSALKQKKISLTQVLPVSERAWRAEGSRMFIEPNKPVTVEEALKGVIVQSGNDACIALAEGIAGSEEAFAQMMNREAQRLGMKNTNFTNSTGLPHPQHHTTAYDMGLLAGATIRDFPEYYPLYALKEYKYNSISQMNRNRLLWLDPYVDGIKTGHTENAGFCLLSSAKRGDRRLISVVMGSASDNVRTIESQKLLNHGFQFYDTVRLYAKGKEVTSIPLWKGAQNSLKAGFNHDLYLSLPKGHAERLKATLERNEPLVAPINAGQKVGTVKLSLDGKAVSEYPLVALETVSPANMFGRAWDSLRLFFN